MSHLSITDQMIYIWTDQWHLSLLHKIFKICLYYLLLKNLQFGPPLPRKNPLCAPIPEALTNIPTYNSFLWVGAFGVAGTSVSAKDLITAFISASA